MEGLRRSFPSLVLGILDSPCLLILLIYAIHKDGYSQSNHSQITRSKNSYTLIQPLPLPCTPACDHQFQELAAQSHLFKFTAPLSRICIWNQVGSLRWSFFAETVKVLNPLAVLAEELHRWCLTEFQMWYSWYSFWGGFHHWSYRRESWTSPAS